MTCACGCGRDVEQANGGRERLYASDACRSRASKAREHREAAIAAASALANLDEDRILRCLAGVPTSALRLIAAERRAALQSANRTR